MALEPLFQCVARSDAREDEHIYATENACAAIAKIIHFNASAIPNIDTVIASWLDTLPIVNDEEEAPHAYNILMDLVERYYKLRTRLIFRGVPAVTSQVPKVFTAVAAAIEYGSIDGKTLSRAVDDTKKLLAALPAGEAQRLFTSMSPERQVAVAEKFD
jgi:importin-5